MVTTVLLGAALLVSGIAAVTDIRTGHIPNWLTFSVLLAAPLVRLLFGGVPGLLASLLGLFGCAALPLFLFYKGGMGGGDLKLFAGLGALLGLGLGLTAEIAAFFAGAVLAIGELAVRGGLFAMLSRAFYLAANPLLPKRLRHEVTPETLVPFRFGASILIGVALVVGRQFWMMRSWGVGA